MKRRNAKNNRGFATQLFFQVFFSICRKVRRAGKYASNASTARGFQGAGLERGGPLLALGRYGWHGISYDEIIPDHFSTAAACRIVVRGSIFSAEFTGSQRVSKYWGRGSRW